MGTLFLSGLLLLGKIKCTLCLKVSVAISDKAFIICVVLRSELGKAQDLHPVSPHHDLLRHKQKMLMHRVPLPAPSAMSCRGVGTASKVQAQMLQFCLPTRQPKSIWSKFLPLPQCPRWSALSLCVRFICYSPPVPSPPCTDIPDPQIGIAWLLRLRLDLLSFYSHVGLRLVMPLPQVSEH